MIAFYLIFFPVSFGIIYMMQKAFGEVGILLTFTLFMALMLLFF